MLLFLQLDLKCAVDVNCDVTSDINCLTATEIHSAF